MDMTPLEACIFNITFLLASRTGKLLYELAVSWAVGVGKKSRNWKKIPNRTKPNCRLFGKISSASIFSCAKFVFGFGIGFDTLPNRFLLNNRNSNEPGNQPPAALRPQLILAQLACSDQTNRSNIIPRTQSQTLATGQSSFPIQLPSVPDHYTVAAVASAPAGRLPVAAQHERTAQRPCDAAA